MKLDGPASDLTRVVVLMQAFMRVIDARVNKVEEAVFGDTGYDDAARLRQALRAVPKSQRLATAMDFGKVEESKLALALNTSVTNICRWKRGEHLPKLVDCEKLAKYFNLSLGEMWGD